MFVHIAAAEISENFSFIPAHSAQCAHKHLMRDGREFSMSLESVNKFASEKTNMQKLKFN